MRMMGGGGQFFVNLDEVDATVRKQDGQKADDAKVPTYIWENHFRDTIPAQWDSQYMSSFPNWNGVCPQIYPLHPAWRSRLESYRVLGLFWWKRNVRRSYWRWIKQKLPPSLVKRTTTNNYVRWTGKAYQWTKNGKDSYTRDLQEMFEHPRAVKNWEPARECIIKASACSWWEWHQGSRPIFWRWPAHRMKWARDGQDHFVTKKLPTYTRAQKPPKSEEDRTKVWKKLSKVRERLYINVGLVLSLMHWFYVLKGETDIRMVYNGTASGINDCLFAPHFGLPIILYVVRSLMAGYFQADMDIGEMFPNFMLGERLRPYSGVDVAHIKTTERDLPHHDPPLTKMPEWEEGRTRRWERWERNWMGLRDSPYRSIQMALIAKEMAYGDHLDENNPFQWDQVKLNLPGQFGYDPTLPWVYKCRKDGHLASDLFLYVDDGRPTGYSAHQCWMAARRFCSMCSFLGVQDASRKRTSPTKTPGPWAGSVVHTDGSLVALVSQKKWDKMKAMIEELAELMEARPDKRVPHKRLEQIRGFAIYVSRTYDWMPPYLKGLHLTIDSWRSGRKRDGWKAKRPKSRFVIWEWEGEQWIDVQPEEYAEATADEAGAPEWVTPVPRLYRDVKALQELFSTDSPAVSVLRPQDSLTTAAYLMGDASGMGFGSALWEERAPIEWEAGNYGVHMQEESSNYRENNNLTTRLELLEKEGKISGKEIFVITDNMAYEGCFYKGHSTSEKLTDLILRLRLLQRRTGSIIHVVHVAGTRMKAAGIDGLSRGDLLEGMMRASSHPLSFLPLAQSAEDRVPNKIKSWVDSWWQHKDGSPWGGSRLKLLAPADWFRLKDIPEPRLWIPPPTAMPTVLEMFNDDHLTRPQLPHVFVVPRLMTHLWRKQLCKDADVVFTVPCFPSFWPAEMHEPLVILIVFPLTFVDRYEGPWLVKGGTEATRTENRLQQGFKLWKESRADSRKLYELEGYLQSMWKGPEEWSRSVLLELLDAAGELPPVRECLVRGMLCRPPPRSLSRSGSTRGRRRDRSRGRRRKSL